MAQKCVYKIMNYSYASYRAMLALRQQLIGMEVYRMLTTDKRQGGQSHADVSNFRFHESSFFFLMLT